ncbi:MAG: hypothetical protein ITG02_02820 [Patulibacter sp.]|nr:hypothetical protein [Patulibacter sp.]
MSVPSRLAAFAVLLGLVFGGAVLLGAATDPTDAPVASTGHGDEPGADDAAHGDAAPAVEGDHDRAATDSGAAGHDAHDPAAPAIGGLAVAQNGYALELDRTRFVATGSARLRFRITDERGRAVRDFRVEHEKRLHMIVVRRDTAVFRHVHPTMRADGAWEVDVALPAAGTYRAYADFTTGDGKQTLGADLFVPGDVAPEALPAPRTTDRAVDGRGSTAAGIDVTLDAPPIRAGRVTTLRFAAVRDGQPLDALEPYLGAKGHLVALREGDLGYLHVHPTEGAAHDHGAGADAAPHANETSFAATFPTAGRYRLFLQFKVDGRVRTVDYTVEVGR